MTSSRVRRTPIIVLAAALVGGLGAGTATMLGQHPPDDPGQYRAAGASGTERWSPSPERTTTTKKTKPTSSTDPTSSTNPTTTSTTTKRKKRSSTPPSTTTTTTTSKQQGPPTVPQESAVVDLVNKRRSDAGCGPVKIDQRLVRAARKHSEDMAARGYFSHDSPEGVTFDERIRAEGHPSPGAENIAKGQRSAEQVMDAWMNSAGHRRNILNCDLSTVGVGLSKQGWLWTQDFGY